MGKKTTSSLIVPEPSPSPAPDIALKDLSNTHPTNWLCRQSDRHPLVVLLEERNPSFSMHTNAFIPIV
jgi:hypothetical protein